MASLKVISRTVLKVVQPKPPRARGHERLQPAQWCPSGRGEGQVPGSQAVSGTGSTGLTTERMWHFKCGQQGPGSLTGQEAIRLAARPGNQLEKQVVGQNKGEPKTPPAPARKQSPFLRPKLPDPFFWNSEEPTLSLDLPLGPQESPVLQQDPGLPVLVCLGWGSTRSVNLGLPRDQTTSSWAHCLSTSST